MFQQLLLLVESFDSMLLEDKVEFITAKQGDKLWDAYEKDKGAGKPKLKDAAEVVKYIADHISDKHLQKLANWYQQGDYFLEDAGKIKDSIEKFEKVRKKVEKKDLSQYKTSAELDAAIAPFDEDDTKSNKQLNREYVAKLFKEKEAELFYEGGGVKIIIPKTEEASKYFGKGTRWCTAAEKNNMFAHYNKPGAPLYIIICDNGEKYQFHFKTGQFMNAEDRPVNVGEIAKKCPVLYDAFEKEAEKWGVMGLIDPKKLTDEIVADIFAKVRKTYAKDPGEVIRWIQENLVRPDVKISGETKKGLIEFFDRVLDSHVYSLLSNCMGAFLKLEPMELVELAKKDPGFHHGHALVTFVHKQQYIEHIYKDKKAFQALIDIVIDRIKSSDNYYTDNYLLILNELKNTLGNQFDLKEWLPDGFLDEIAIKHGAESIKLVGYEPPEAIQLKMVEKDYRNIEHMPYATNKVKERARMFERAQKDRGRYSGR
jgi:hypothetical protein